MTRPRLLALAALTAIPLCAAFALAAQPANPPLTPVTADNLSQLIPLASLDLGPVAPRALPDSIAVAGPTLLARGDRLQQWDLITFDAAALPDATVAALSPDGTSAVLITREPATILLDLTTGQSQTLLNAPIAPVNAWFSPNGRTVLTLTGVLQLWDSATGAELAALPAASLTPRFSADGDSLLYFASDRALTRWSIADRRPLRTFPTTLDTAIAFFHPDGRHLVTADPHRFQIWDAQTGALVSDTEHGVAGYSHTALLSPSGDRLLVFAAGYPVHVPGQPSPRLWSLDSLAQPTLLADLLPNTRAQFSPNGQSLALWDGSTPTLRLYDAATGALRAEPLDLGLYYGRVAFSPQSDLLAAWDPDGPVHLLRPDGRAAEPATLPGTAAVWSPDGTTLLTSVGQVLLAFGLPSEARPARPLQLSAAILPSEINLRAQPDPDAPVVGLAPRGPVLVTGRSGGFLALPELGGWVRNDPSYIQLDGALSPDWLAELDPALAFAPTRTPTATPTAYSPRPTRTPLPTPGTPAPLVLPTRPATPPPGSTAITAITLPDVQLLAVLPGGLSWGSGYSLSADGSRLFLAPFVDTTAHIWDLRDLAALPAPPPSDLQDYSPARLTPSGDQLLFKLPSPYQNGLQIWDVAAGRTLAALDVPFADRYAGFEISPDGTTVALFNDMGGSSVWDLASRSRLATLPAAVALVFSPDSQLLAATSRGLASVWLYDAHTGAPLRHLELGYVVPGSLSFSPAVTRLAVLGDGPDNASQDGLTLVDLDGQNPLFIPGHFTAAVWHPSADVIATLDTTNRARLWNSRSGRLLTEYTADSTAGLAFSPDGALLALDNPVGLIQLETGDSFALPAPYASVGTTFTADGATLLVDGWRNTLVFGIPSTLRPAWTPLTGTIRSSGVSLRARPEVDAPVLGYVSGNVRISGRASGAVYLPDQGGWIWSDPDYINLGSHTLSDLPALLTTP